MANRGERSGRRERGTVTLWQDARGYGRIKADDGAELFVIFSRLAIPPMGSPTGLRVEFSRVHDDRLYADRVVALDSSGKPSVILTEP